MRISSLGLIAIDAQNPSGGGPPMEQIRQAAPNANLTMRAVVLTSASVAPMLGPLLQGAPKGALDSAAAAADVIVHKHAMTPALQEALRARSGQTTPRVFTYDTDYMLRVGDVEVEIEHVGRGRTGADSVAYFRDLRVVAVGGLYTTAMLSPECATGGSYAGWAAAITHVLEYDFDLVVPRLGAPVGRRELVALRAQLQSLAAGAAVPSGSNPAHC